MGWANTVSAFGTGVEVIGFVVLAWELRKTNTSAIVEVEALRKEPADAQNLIYRDGVGDTAGIFFEGGKIGILIDSLNERQKDLSTSKRLIFYGLVGTGVGIAIQLVGAIGQAVAG